MSTSHPIERNSSPAKRPPSDPPITTAYLAALAWFSIGASCPIRPLAFRAWRHGPAHRPSPRPVVHRFHSRRPTYRALLGMPVPLRLTSDRRIAPRIGTGSIGALIEESQGSQLTHRWREPDSNHRSRGKRPASPRCRLSFAPYFGWRGADGHAP